MIIKCLMAMSDYNFVNCFEAYVPDDEVNTESLALINAAITRVATQIIEDYNFNGNQKVVELIVCSAPGPAGERPDITAAYSSGSIVDVNEPSLVERLIGSVSTFILSEEDREVLQFAFYSNSGMETIRRSRFIRQPIGSGGFAFVEFPVDGKTRDVQEEMFTPLFLGLDLSIGTFLHSVEF